MPRINVAAFSYLRLSWVHLELQACQSLAAFPNIVVGVGRTDNPVRPALPQLPRQGAQDGGSGARASAIQRTGRPEFRLPLRHTRDTGKDSGSCLA
jgi:hypothetical protein